MVEGQIIRYISKTIAIVYTLKISDIKLDMVGPVRESYSRNSMKSLSDSVRDLLEEVRFCRESPPRHDRLPRSVRSGLAV